MALFVWLCWILTGKQARGMKRRKGRGRLEERGPLPKAKRRSLKVASQEMKKDIGPLRTMALSFRGRTKKRSITGRSMTNLVKPCLTILAML